MPQQATTTLFSPAEVAEMLKVRPATVRRWIAEGSLHALRIGNAPNAPLRVPLAEIVEHVETTKEPRMPDADEQVATADAPVPSWHLDGSLDFERELLIRRERLRFLGLLDDEEGVS